LVAIDYATKWVEAQAFRTNTVVVTTKFLYKCIIMKIGCPLTIVTNQGIHFINDALMYLIGHFILRHTNSIIYCPQGNGLAKSTNKVFGALLTKMVNDNINDWDKHLSTILFSY
jgi:hypothetical protein